MKKDNSFREIEELLSSVFSRLKIIDKGYYTAGKVSLEIPVVKRNLRGKKFFQIADADHDFPKEKILKIKLSELMLKPTKETVMADILEDIKLED